MCAAIIRRISGTILTIVACQLLATCAVASGEQGNALRNADSGSSFASSDSQVRVVPRAGSVLGKSADAHDVWSTAAHASSERPTASQSTVRSWVAGARPAEQSSKTEQNQPEVIRLGTTVTQDDQIVPTTHRQAAPRPLEPPQSATHIDARAGTPRPLTTAQLLEQAHQLAGDAKSEQDYNRVLQACQRVVQQDSERVATDYARELASWALNRRGELRLGAGRRDEALTDFEAAVKFDPLRWRAVHNRGVLLAQAGKFEQAFDDFNRTITLNPKFAKAYSNRAALFVIAGDLPTALEDYQRAAELDPNMTAAQRGQARVCHRMGRLDESLRHYDTAVRLASRDGYTITCRADLLTDLGRYADAAAEYDRAIELEPQLSLAYRSSAWLLATCPDGTVRNPVLAVKRARRAMQLEPKPDAISYDTLAAAQASAGDFRAAADTIRRAIDAAPDQERLAYQDRLRMYERSQAFRIAPLEPVRQASYTRDEASPDGRTR